MTDNLKNFAGSLKIVERQEGDVVLRFHFGYCFEPNLDSLIARIALSCCSDAKSVASTLQSWIGEEIDGLEVIEVDGGVTVIIDLCWANDGNPFSINAKSATVTREHYNIDDYKVIHKQLDESLTSEWQARRKLERSIEEYQNHLVKEITRVEKKLEFFEDRSDTKLAHFKGKLEILQSVSKFMKNCEQIDSL